MTNHSDSQVPRQEIFKNVQADGNITVGNITQIYKTVNNLGELPKPTGFPQNIPASSTDKFVGREGELERLHQQLQQNTRVVIAAVEGMGGVGKTELAIQYSLLHLQLHSYPGGICWLRARESDIGLQIIQFATTDLGKKPPEDLELPEQVRWCWQNWQQGNTLIVLDDVNNYSHIKPYLPPQASQFKVLITTRLKLDLASSVFLEVLSETDALLLLTQLIGEEKQNQELVQAQELCQRLGYLPLALQLVSRYVKKHKITLAEMLRRLEEKGLGHPSLVVKEIDPNWTLNVKRGVAAAFELSWSELSDDAQQLGCLLSLFALAPIPWSLVERAAREQDPQELEDARVELENLHLLQGQDIYQLHQLIQEFLKNKQENLASADEQKFSFCQAMVKVAQKVPNSPTRDFQLLTPFMVHVEATTALSKWLGNQERINIYKSLGIFYEGQGLYNKSKERFEQCLSVSQNQWGDKHSDIAISLNYLALLDLYQGRWQKAEDKCQKALKIFDEQENHPVKAKTLTHLGIIYTNQGKWTEAILQYQQALKICQQLEDHYEDEEACTLGNLANIYYLQGAWEEATQIYQQVLNIFAQSGNYRREGQTLVALGNLLYLWQGNLEEAVKFYEKALEIFSELKEPRGEGQTLGNLSSLRLLEGKCDEADEQHQKALEIFRRIEDPKNEATVLINRGNVYRLRGNLEKAKEYYQQALNIFHEKIGDRLGEAQVLTNLGTIYADQGEWDLAKEKYFEAQGLFFELGDRQSEAQVLINLGNIYRCQGRQSEALGLFSQALDIFKMMGVGDRQGEGLVLMNLGSLYTDQGCWSEAIKKCNEALEIFWELGNLQCEAETLIRLGIAYTDQEDWDKGIENCQQAIAIFSQIKCCQGEGQALGNLGNIYFLQGNKEKAVELWQEALIKLPVGSLACKRIDEWLKSINCYL